MASARSSQSSHKERTPDAAPARVGLGHASVRKGLTMYAVVLGMTVAIITVLVWTFGTLYWGSLYNPQAHLYRLTAVVVNRDGNGAIGQAVSSGLLALNSASSPHMTYSVVDGSAYPTQADVDEAVHYKLSTWLAIEVAENASQQLAAARAAGNASWDPTSVITATYVQARNQATIDGQVLAFFRPAITRIMAELNAQLAAEYLSANSGNAAAIAALAAAPQTIGAPVGLTYRNLAMYPTVANAATFVGLIYLCILAFNVTMAGGAIRDAFGLDLKLNARSQVLLRLGGPFLCYIILSLMWSLLELPFHLPFGGNFSHGAGFMVWWMFTLLGMAVLGYWTEGFYALVGAKWVAYSLLVIILTNVSGANLAVEAQNAFYKFSYAMPFYVTKNAYLNILFHVGYRAELAKSFGILVGWLILSLVTIPIWLRLERKRLIKAKAAGSPGPPAKKQDEEKASSAPHDVSHESSHDTSA